MEQPAIQHEIQAPQGGFNQFSAVTIQGDTIKLDTYSGQVVLVVNVASKCGFTPQYEGLEALYRKYKDQGFVVLGFPCNQFSSQEPGNDAEIAKFCKLKYDVSFPMFRKIDVNGASAHPLYAWLKAQAPGILGTESIKWNFTKFLLNRSGQVVARYAPNDKPESLAKDIEKLLPK